MKNHLTLVVVANGSVAKIYKKTSSAHLEQLAILDHPASRLHNRDLVSAGPGHTGQMATGGTRKASMEPKTEPHAVEVESFARTLAAFLETTCQKTAFASFYLFASSEFLGVLRPLLGKKTKEVLHIEIAKDFTGHKPDDIEKEIAAMKSKATF
jgi:protein required for attachment to host cells